MLSSLETVIELLGTYDITTIRASMGMYLLCKAIHERTDIRVLRFSTPAISFSRMFPQTSSSPSWQKRSTLAIS